MINTGKCPKCQNVITYVDLEAITVGGPFSQQWKGISCLCPSCLTVLSVAIDPIAIKTDIINAVKV